MIVYAAYQQNRLNKLINAVQVVAAKKKRIIGYSSQIDFDARIFPRSDGKEKPVPDPHNDHRSALMWIPGASQNDKLRLCHFENCSR